MPENDLRLGSVLGQKIQVGKSPLNLRSINGGEFQRGTSVLDELNLYRDIQVERDTTQRSSTHQRGTVHIRLPVPLTVNRMLASSMHQVSGSASQFD